MNVDGYPFSSISIHLYLEILYGFLGGSENMHDFKVVSHNYLCLPADAVDHYLFG